MQLTVNGKRVAVEERPGESRLQLLREQVGLRSMKDGCAPEGSCGACTVIVDGRAVVSCAQRASRFADRDVLTLEGLSADGRADWADAFVRGGASQCGFCSPGVVLEGQGLVARVPKYAAREQVLGEHAFVADMRVPGMLHGALRFSDHPRATVLRIDTTPAAAYPGVRSEERRVGEECRSRWS